MREKHTVVIGPRLKMIENLGRFEEEEKERKREETKINQMLSLNLRTDTSIIINIKEVITQMKEWKTEIIKKRRFFERIQELNLNTIIFAKNDINQRSSRIPPIDPNSLK